MTKANKNQAIIERLATALTYYREHEPEVRAQAKFITNLACRFELSRKTLVRALRMMSEMKHA